MQPYRQNLKLVLREDGQHKFSIRVSDNCVDTYIVDDAWLGTMCDSWQDTSGVTWTHNDVDWFVQDKQVGMPSEYVRISAWPHGVGGCGRDYRVGRADMQDMSDQLASANK